MGLTLVEKVIKSHSKTQELIRGNKISLQIDQTLTQDATGTMAYLQFEALNVSRVKTKLSVAYVDHNTLQNGFMNADDHDYIASVAKKFGIVFSKPGNGICHQLHLERFAKPAQTLIGSDSHTPTCGAMAMLAFGAGGFDVACAMAGYPYTISMPKIVKINLKGRLRQWVSAKDIILKILQILGVKGGVLKAIEYDGEGLHSLTVPQRATIANMGAELGATTSIFPSDEITLQFLKSQGRESDWQPLSADSDAVYDETYEINLSELEPMVACPHSPDNVELVKNVKNLKVDQVCIGSCTNSSFADLMAVAQILKGKTVSENTSLVISPGSRQVMSMLIENGALADMLNAGARILECSCGPCIGMGQSPGSKGVSLRTFNRNFIGRSGTADARIYLVSPEVAAYSALRGYLSSPLELDEPFILDQPVKFKINDNMFIQPASIQEAAQLEIRKGPNIKPFPVGRPLSSNFEIEVGLKVSDDITTDHIMPAGAKILPYRSNVEQLSKFCFEVVDSTFSQRALNLSKLGINVAIVAGHNYGQGSSREHAALVPLYLGVKVVLAKSFARIHKANLINCGILPLVFADEADYDKLKLDQKFKFENIFLNLETNSLIELKSCSEDVVIKCVGNFSTKEKQILIAGGLLNLLKKSIPDEK